jgi:ParB family transcriptional regulator, chromosome partitioning protein
MGENDVIAPSKLANLPIDKIFRNPHNPRTLFDPEPLKMLLESIKELGILVPLLVYENKMGNYVILDGERRWRCAKELGFKTVPANVIEEPSAIDNILRMFNIHNVRESWELMPTALKLEVIIRELNTDNEIKLAKITSLTRSTVRRCKILLNFDKKYQDMMLNTEPDARMKPDLFIEMYPVLGLISEELPEISIRFPGNKLIDAFISRYMQGQLDSVTDFRKITSSIKKINDGLRRTYVKDALLNFLLGQKTKLNDLMNIIDNFKEAQSMMRSCETLTEHLQSFQAFPKDITPEMKQVLLNLKKVVEDKLALIE